MLSLKLTTGTEVQIAQGQVGIEEKRARDSATQASYKCILLFPQDNKWPERRYEASLGEAIASTHFHIPHTSASQYLPQCGECK